MAFDAPETTVVGNVVADPERRVLDGGKVVTNFRVAYNERVRQADGSYANGEAEYYKAAAWNSDRENGSKLADHAAAGLKKGDRVRVEGRLKPRIYTNNEGQPVLSLDMTAYKIELVTPVAFAASNNKGGNGNGNGGNTNANANSGQSNGGGNANQGNAGPAPTPDQSVDDF